MLCLKLTAVLFLKAGVRLFFPLRKVLLAHQPRAELCVGPNKHPRGLPAPQAPASLHAHPQGGPAWASLLCRLSTAHTQACPPKAPEPGHGRWGPLVGPPCFCGTLAASTAQLLSLCRLLAVSPSTSNLTFLARNNAGLSEWA